MRACVLVWNREQRARAIACAEAVRVCVLACAQAVCACVLACARERTHRSRSGYSQNTAALCGVLDLPPVTSFILSAHTHTHTTHTHTHA